MNKLIRSQYQSKINLTTSVDVSKIARPKEGWRLFQENQLNLRLQSRLK